MKVLIIVAIVVIFVCLIGISDRITEIEAHQRVIESMLDDLKKK